jgi:hypothetical protein
MSITNLKIALLFGLVLIVAGFFSFGLPGTIVGFAFILDLWAGNDNFIVNQRVFKEMS